MASTYPTTVDSFITNVDNVDVVSAADINNLQDSVSAIETSLGTGSAATSLAVGNSVVRRDVEGILYHNDYYAVIGSTATNTITSTLASWTAVNFDTIYKQTGGIWIPQFASVLFFIKSGLVTVGTQVSWPANATGVRGLGIQMNLTTFIACKTEEAVSSGPHHMSLTRTWPVIAGQYCRVMVQQSSGGNLTLTNQPALSPEVTVHYQ